MNWIFRYILICLFSAPLFAAGDNQLIDAIKRGDSTAAAGLIGGSAEANQSEADGTTALHWAVHRNNMKISEQLLFAGANVNVVNDYGVTPLYLACTNRNNELAKKLLVAGADPNATLWSGETVLMNCSKTGATEAVTALLTKGANPNAKESKKDQTALMWAAAEGHGEISQLLVEHGADIHAKSSSGFTPLLFAARSGDIDSARTIIDAGADPNESTPEHGTALVITAAGGHEDLGIYLLSVGADPDATDENGISALHHSMASGMAALNGVRYDPVYRQIPDNLFRLAEALLKAGADPNLQIKKSKRLGPDGSPFDMVGATPFLLASISADTQMMALLDSYEADLNISAKGGINSLMAAARAACTGACAFKGGNKANEKDIKRSFDAVKTVIEMGIDIDTKNEEGQTAMHMAAFTGNDLVVKYLADNGADINVTDNYGETPWSMASGISPVLRYRGLYGYHESTAKLLEQLGATTTSRDAMDSNAPPPPGQ
jgi:ankyrin repeat protein